MVATAIPGVTVESVEHATGQAVIHSTAVVPDSLLGKAIAKAGYKLTGTNPGISGDRQ